MGFLMDEYKALSKCSNSWPFAEARTILKSLKGKAPKKGFVLFETGYGPSGLPHIGTFGEVARTIWVQNAFQKLSDIPTKLFAFSDDMDGLRKVPDNVPDQKMISAHLGKPLTLIPDPFKTHKSFGDHNNAKLRTFLDKFGFDYEFKSSTELYKKGYFDSVLINLLENYEAVIDVILPSLGKERQATYSPFLPICPKTNIVLQVPIVERKIDTGTIIYKDPKSEKLTEVPVTGGHCKLQWKPDWAMRWTALDVNYEMSGKDLVDSVIQSSKICKILGGTPPVGFSYELFLDENGEKISKSKGNGLSVEEWLKYAPPESLSNFMFSKPKTAKRLYFDIIPRQVDEYLRHLTSYIEQETKKRIDNPVWHIHRGTPPFESIHLSFNVLLNLASVCNSEEKKVLWYFISRYRPDANPVDAPFLDRLVDYAIAYYRDFVKPNKNYRFPNTEELRALEELATNLEHLPKDSSAEDIQTILYSIGKKQNYSDLRDWFKALYEILLGQKEGPRMGSFIALYGITETIDLIHRILSGKTPSSK
tara:strand:- start:3818 stop:5419 length:1602 start_codon:yes stop_codon:yes gene_type:complete